MSQEKWICEALRAVEAISPPRFAMPRLACDCHMHVFGPADIYKSVSDARYELPDADLDAYLTRARVLGLERMVFVQPSFYGADNACVLDSMRIVGSGSRGVVFLPEGAPPSLIDGFHKAGVRGVRLDLFKAEEQGLGFTDIVAKLDDAARIAKSVGWHVELYSPGRLTHRLLDRIDHLGAAFSINHMGYMTKDDGLTDADFDRFVDFVSTSRCWVKLTAPYRVDKTGRTPRTDRMARRLVEKAPDRVIWGTDWPHIPHCGMDTGELLNRLAEWCPDPLVRAKILVANPARLYQFE